MNYKGRMKLCRLSVFLCQSKLNTIACHEHETSTRKPKSSPISNSSFYKCCEMQSLSTLRGHNDRLHTNKYISWIVQLVLCRGNWLPDTVWTKRTGDSVIARFTECPLMLVYGGRFWRLHAVVMKTDSFNMISIRLQWQSKGQMIYARQKSAIRSGNVKHFALAILSNSSLLNEING